MAKLISTALLLVAIILAGICVMTPVPVDAAGFCSDTLYKTHKCHLGHCRLECYHRYDSYGANCIPGKKGAMAECICVHNKC